MRKAADAHGLKVITEVMDEAHIDVVCQYADIIQIGARNMQNFQLLKEVGHTNKPVLLKRGLSATISEWLNAAEYIASVVITISYFANVVLEHMKHSLVIL